ncbi:MAG TPA: DUF3592 domain-containing protein [Actinomycetota bacterium]|nr:DUF3592 domain-containing protein [Actinomycetota bacterium]
MGMFTPMTWSRGPGRWLTITAIFELVLAGVFLVIGFNNPILKGGFILTAAILGGVGLLLLLWGRRWSRAFADAQRLRTQGVPGQATITGMRQTGVSVNEQPQVELHLRVQTEMHGPYDTTVKEYVPLMMLGALSSGRPLPVKVDPANPQRLVIEWENALGVPGQMAAPLAPPPGDYEATKQQLLATGVLGKATVVSSAPTGEIDPQGRPVYDLVMKIEIEGQQPMQGPARVGIPPERAEQLEPGDTVPIKADPNNPAMMAVDWENA